MKTIDSSRWILLFVIMLFSLIYFTGIAEVPFHPDESSQIFMSSDLEMLTTQPDALTWKAENSLDIRQRYRLLDAPLTRWMIAIGRQLAGEPPIQSDWDWSQDWQTNLNNGALPSPRLLAVARFSVAFVFPLVLWLSFKIGERLAGKRAGWLNLILTATNGLVLLHTRRSMAESLLFFGFVLFLFLLLSLDKRLWLISIPAALAFNAKYSAAPLVIVGVIPILLVWVRRPLRPKQSLTDLGLYLALFIAITLALNPVLWSSPRNALKSAAEERSRLLSAQTAMIGSINPALAPDTLAEKSVALIAQLYLTQSAIADVGNYRAQTGEAQRLYFSRPWNNLYQGVVSGGFLLALTLIGLLWMVVHLIRRTSSAPRPVIFFLITFLAQMAGILASIPLSFQRYYLPLVPFVTVLIAYGIHTGLELGAKPKSSAQD